MTNIFDTTMTYDQSRGMFDLDRQMRSTRNQREYDEIVRRQLDMEPVTKKDRAEPQDFRLLLLEEV